MLTTRKIRGVYGYLFCLEKRFSSRRAQYEVLTKELGVKSIYAVVRYSIEILELM